MKKLIAVSAIAAFVLLTVAIALPAKAASVDSVSDESVVGITGRWFANLFQRVFHKADIDNDTVSSTANSGGNRIVSDDDQSNTSVGTGNTTSATLVDNSAANTATNADLEAVDGTNDTVSNVTDESKVNTDYRDQADDNFRVENKTEVDNDVDSTADAGNNTVNSGDDLDFSALNTGSADSATGVSNMFSTVLRDFFRTIRSM